MMDDDKGHSPTEGIRLDKHPFFPSTDNDASFRRKRVTSPGNLSRNESRGERGGSRGGSRGGDRSPDKGERGGSRGGSRVGSPDKGERGYDRNDSANTLRTQSRERHYGLQLEELERMALSEGPIGDEESAKQEAALSRVRSFMRGMGE